MSYLLQISFEKKKTCYIQKFESNSTDPYRLVIYDFEATQDYKPDDNISKFLHQVNFICVKIVCTEKLAKCVKLNYLLICGKIRTIIWSHKPFNKTKVILKKFLKIFKGG